jgi:aminoglycoside/choline kinase family phosphotransferase
MPDDQQTAASGGEFHEPRENPAFAWAEARLAALGAPSLPIWAPLPEHASHRRFYRGAFPTDRARSRWGPTESVILMTSPPALEQNVQFARLAALFRAAGIGVPEVHAHAEAEGWFLLEDLGDRHFDQVYATPERDLALAGALSTLHTLQTVSDPAIPPYTATRFHDELRIFTDWFVQGLLAESPDRAVTADTFGLLVGITQSQLQCCVHRDYHCQNLLLRSDGTIGVVDFQDALVGPASYDLASLLRDCYYRFDEPEIARWRERYLATSALPLDPQAFRRELDLTAVQRQLKAIGIFARLWLRDGKRTHLQWIMPVLARLIDVCAGYPEIAPLAAWLRQLQQPAAQKLAGLA